MDTNQKVKAAKAKGIYLLPNMFTTAGLFAAFYAIVAAMKGNFDVASIAIFVAMLADAVDGRVARLTNTASEFGAQYDSLADMVSFGVAPALIAYSWSLHGLGKMGWLIAFAYAATAALRLARFNVQIGTVDKKYFYGLPSPAAAAILASFVWLGHENQIDGTTLRYIVALITIFPAAMMVSNVRFYSFKDIDFKGRVPYVATSLIVLTFVAISIDPPVVLFLLFFGYGLSGPVNTLLTLRRAKQISKKRAEKSKAKEKAKVKTKK